MRIQRTIYGVVSEDNGILVGHKETLRFVPEEKVTSHEKVLLYESKKKAESALNDSWHFQRLARHTNYRIAAFEQILREEGEMG